MEFDPQADSFDRRAGLPAAACTEIVAAVLALARPAATDLCLEIGAGTGQLGALLATRMRYLGLDQSYSMLRLFRRRGQLDRHPALLLQADAGRRWPVASNCARIVFGARVMHLLNAAHVATEAARVAGPGGCLLIGQVRRDPAGVKARLRGLLHELLQRRGFQPVARGPAHASLTAAARDLGGTGIDLRPVCRWTVAATPAASLQAWRSKPGLAGLDLPDPVHAEVLAALESRARRVYGDLGQPVRSQETYWLEGVRFGPPAKPV